MRTREGEMIMDVQNTGTRNVLDFIKAYLDHPLPSMKDNALFD